MPERHGHSELARACMPCAAELRPLQEELAARNANCHKVNNLDDHQKFLPAAVRPYATGPFTRDLGVAIRNATYTLMSLEDPLLLEDKQIPKAILNMAQGFVFVTFMRFSVIGGLRIGSGLAVVKREDGSWSAPSAVGLGGFSVGFMAGTDKVNLCLVLTNKSACSVLNASKGQLNLGAEVGATLGPLGRNATVGASFGNTGVAPVVAYSQSCGLFVGIDLNGCWLSSRPPMNQRFYGVHHEPAEILNGNVPQPEAGRPLYEALDRVCAVDDES